MTTWNFDFFTQVTPSVFDGTATSFTVASATQAGVSSVTENDNVMTFGSGGLPGYHNSNDTFDSYTIPFSNGVGALLIHDGYYNFGGVEGIIVLADATGRCYLVTDTNPGFAGGEGFTTSAVDF